MYLGGSVLGHICLLNAILKSGVQGAEDMRPCLDRLRGVSDVTTLLYFMISFSCCGVSGVLGLGSGVPDLGSGVPDLGKMLEGRFAFFMSSGVNTKLDLLVEFLIRLTSTGEGTLYVLRRSAAACLLFPTTTVSFFVGVLKLISESGKGALDLETVSTSNSLI